MSDDFYNNKILPHKGILIKLCRAYTDNQEDFEDHFQEVCLQIWKSRTRFQAQCKWSTWVYRITLNVTMLKKRKKKATLESDIHTEIITSEAFGDEDLQLLYAAIQKLSEVDKAIIVLYLESKSYKEIAEITGLEVSAIGTRIHRIKTKLKIIIYGE